MAYRELRPPAPMRDLVETAWVLDGPGNVVRVLPDGCMDLIWMDGRVMVAGPDTTASLSIRGAEPFAGLRFRPGTLPRLLGVPAAELRDQRVALDELRQFPPRGRLTEVATDLVATRPRRETTPWSVPTLHHVTARLSAGASVADVAREVGWSGRTLQRQCAAVYGYGPVTLRRILRFRRAVAMLRTGRAPAEVAAEARYSDQPHLHREVRALAGTTVTDVADG